MLSQQESDVLALFFAYHITVFALSDMNDLISFCSYLMLVTAKIWTNCFFKMLKIVVLLSVFQILVVKSSNNGCLKSYKKKLCLRRSIQNFDLCLYERFNVFEENNKFCFSNTKCVPKTLSCSGFCCLTLELKLKQICYKKYTL